MYKVQSTYENWLRNAIGDDDIKNELRDIALNSELIEERFYKDLSFGTGGLRGIIGAGTNRMNIYTVAKASQGLANYIIKKFCSVNCSIAISYDSRIKSELFSKITAGVFAANGIHVYIYPHIMPTPCLSYAVRYLHCSAGVMITASHNPSKYNGYKVYDAEGCQITTDVASEIYYCIEELDIFKDVKQGNFNEEIEKKNIEYIEETVYTAFVEEVKKQTPIKYEDFDKKISIVYTPLNGTGLDPVTRVLHETGYSNIVVVKEQEEPDGNFPTCPYPNPELKETMRLGIDYAKKYDADIVLATDPDCDRCGVAVKKIDGDFQLLSGDETGLLLLDFICSQRIKNGTMPKRPVLIKSIVTSDMGEQIANHYDVKTINVLTGFKYIGEQICCLERMNQGDRFIFGFEESCGYLSGGYVRDKDAVGAAFLICELFAYYKSKGISLFEKLKELYNIYGFRLNTIHSYEFEGVLGLVKMQNIMQKFREELDKIGGKRVEKKLDYSLGIDDLPKSDVLKYQLEGNSSVVIRPSGTEPKLKVYISVVSDSMENTNKLEKAISVEIGEFMK